MRKNIISGNTQLVYRCPNDQCTHGTQDFITHPRSLGDHVVEMPTPVCAQCRSVMVLVRAVNT